MKRIATLALTMAFAFMAMPATADVEVNGPCANTGGLPVVSVAAASSNTVDTPVGVLGIGDDTDMGTYLVDLEGVEVGKNKSIDVLLSWTNGTFDELSDYDMDVNGENYNASDTSEAASLSMGHCQTISVSAYSYIGTPADEMTLDLSVSQWGF